MLTNQDLNHRKQLSRGTGINLSSSSSSYYRNDSGGDNNGDSDQQGGCLGGCIGGWLGRDGRGGKESTSEAAAPNDDPTLLVAEELSKLSLKEREIVYEDLHGVSMLEDESNQEFVNQRLNDMNVEIDTKIPRSKKAAYLIAMEETGETGKEFCQDQSLHLMFLRADCWDSKKAATRFVGWLDWKLELFGRDVLCHRHVPLDQLDKGGQKMVQSGLLQILPQRDTSGRTVVFNWFGHPKHFSYPRKSFLQCFWYILMATIEDDIQTQRMGIASILYAVEGTLSFTAEELKSVYDCSGMVSMLPVRLSSVHYCFNNPKIVKLVSFIQRAVGSHIRVRFRSHTGKHTEIQYSLMTFGVPVNVLPVVTDGNIKKTNHLKWFKRHKTRDSTLYNRAAGGGADRGNISLYGIDLPCRFDVLLGKGDSIQQHMGNRRLKELVSIHFHEYDTALHGDKKLIAEKIINLISNPCSEVVVVVPPIVGQSRHCHVENSTDRFQDGAPQFLKQRDDGWWAPVPHEEAIEKVCHSFRAFRNRPKASMVRRTTDDVRNRVSSSSSSSSPPSSSSSLFTSGRGNGAPTTTAAAKRAKVEAQNVVEPEMPALNHLPNTLLSMLDEEEGQQQQQQLETSTLVVDTPNNATTIEDELLLELDGFDW